LGSVPIVAPKHIVVSTGPIVVLGASYAAGWKLESIGGVPVINHGVAGQQSFEMLARFDSDVVPERPRAVILWGFINDIFRAPWDHVEPARARVRESYVEMIARARRHGIEPILATEVTVRPRTGSSMERVRAVIGAMWGKEGYQDRINSHVLALNRWIVETGARERLLVLQFQPVLCEAQGRRRPAFAQPDGSHITPAGYDALTSYATPILEDFLVAR
jgi:acyl-CoA thioesterase-1